MCACSSVYFSASSRHFASPVASWRYQRQPWKNPLHQSQSLQKTTLPPLKPDRHMDPFRIEFAADGVDTVSAHEGEELIICLAGEVELSYGPDKTVLKAGDTAYYNSVVKHGLRAVGGKPASIYGVVFMPF